MKSRGWLTVAGSKLELLMHLIPLPCFNIDKINLLLYFGPVTWIAENNFFIDGSAVLLASVVNSEPFFRCI